MGRWLWCSVLILAVLTSTAGLEPAVARQPEGTLTVAVATFGNERWEVLEGGKAWRFSLRKGVRFHSGQEMTAEDVKFTFAAIAKDGSANSLAPEFRLIKSMDIEDPYTITFRFAKSFVAFGNKVTQGLFGSAAFIHSKKYIETAGEEGAERRPAGRAMAHPAHL